MTSSERQSRRPDLFACAALTLLCLAYWFGSFVHGTGLADWDIVSFYLPWYSHMGESLRNLDIPGWNPYILSGTPFAGDPQSGWWYFPAMVLFTALPATSAFKALILFHFLLASLGMYIFARLLGIGAIGAFAGAIVFGISQNAGIASCCTIHLQLAPWLPVALIGIELSLKQDRWSKRLPGLSLSAVAISQIAAAWVGQGMYYALLVVGTYFVWRSLLMPLVKRSALRKQLASTLGSGAITFGLGFMLAAAGLLPRLDVVRRSFVGSDTYKGEIRPPAWGTDWFHVVEMLTRFRWDWYPFYIGGAALVLALIGAAASLEMPRLRYFVAIWLIVAVLPVRDTPIQRFFYLLPEFQNLHMHDPKRILVVFPLATAALVAGGVHGLQSQLQYRRVRLAAPVLALATFTYCFFNWHRYWSKPNHADYIIAVSAVATAIVLIASDRRKSHLLQWVGVAILIGALIWDPAGMAFRKSLGTPYDHQMQQTVDILASGNQSEGSSAFLKALDAEVGPFRYFGFVGPSGEEFQAHELFARDWVAPLLINNRAMRLGLYDAQGYDPAQLNSYLEYFAILNGFRRDYHEALVYRQGVGSPLLDMLNVEYVIVPVDESLYPDAEGALRLPSDYALVYEDSTARIYRNPNALPRAWTVHEVQSMSALNALNALAQGTADPRKTALVDNAIVSVQPLAEGTIDRVEVTTYQPDSVEISVSAGSDAMLILADVMDSGWNATVDGDKVSILTVNGLLRGVAVPAGTHTVHFEYQPASLTIGVLVSSIAALAMVTLLVLSAALNWNKQLPESHV